MMKNARSLLENVKYDKFDSVKVRDKFTSKNEFIKFKKKNIKGDINDNNKLREYFTHLKSIRSTLNNAPEKSNDIKKHIKYLDDIKKYYLLMIMIIKTYQVRLELMKQGLLKIKKEKDM